VTKRTGTGTGTEAADAAATRLEPSFSFRVSILAKLLDRRLGRLAGEQFGLALAEYRVLAQVAQSPKSTVRAVAAHTFIDKAQVSRAMAVLAEQKLVARSLSGPDRRSPEFTATRSGRALMNRIIPLRQAQERELSQHLTQQPGRIELATLTRSVQALIDHLGEPVADVGAEPSASQRRGAIRAERVRRSRPAS